MAGLAVEQRNNITHFMYDDMCHLKVKVHKEPICFHNITLPEICLQQVKSHKE